MIDEQGKAPLSALLADAARELLGNHGPPLGTQLTHQLNDLGILLHGQHCVEASEMNVMTSG